MRTVFAPDADIEIGPRKFADLEAFISHLKNRDERPSWTIHHGHMPQIELLDDGTRATALWDVAAHAGYAQPAGDERIVAVLGRHHGELNKSDTHVWRYTRLTYVVLSGL